MRSIVKAHSSLMSRYSDSSFHLRVRNSMIAARPCKNSLRFLQRLSVVYARATFAGSRVFQASSALRTFTIAVSRVKGGTGGRTSAAAFIGGSPVRNLSFSSGMGPPRRHGGAPFASIRHRLEHLGGVGVHVEFRKLVAAHGPNVG